MNELTSHKLKRAVQFIIYIPNFFSWVVVGGLFALMLSPRLGIINRGLEMLGFDTIFFMGSVRHFRGVLITSQIWKSAGFGTVVFVAAISTINPELYDAANIDGAGHLRRAWHITLPCIRNVIATVLLLNIANILGGFEQVFIMYNPVVYEVADTIGSFSYREAFRMGNLGYGTAIGVFVSVVTLILVVGTRIFSTKVLDEKIL